MKKEASLLGNKDLFCSFYKEPFGIILKLRLFALSSAVRQKVKLSIPNSW